MNEKFALTLLFVIELVALFEMTDMDAFEPKFVIGNHGISI